MLNSQVPSSTTLERLKKSDACAERAEIGLWLTLIRTTIATIAKMICRNFPQKTIPPVIEFNWIGNSVLEFSSRTELRHLSHRHVPPLHCPLRTTLRDPPGLRTPLLSLQPTCPPEYPRNVRTQLVKTQACPSDRS